ncbi:uncharacterized protein LOC108631021 isoform X1 [Ceratina calcarata]|uniref:Uncharacterized protein LOC108631021 isoform X1 n=1 Tax=Ceratina calcarata TaxID=156304 RepID=A0AAJ7JDC6_9HYME|nr:uncharacterized protein LOC108631021 isoform X1 [Ceratina calcarata]XP_026674311.1 uncharacterized protein LOC108631021 isoform X1 [Ceratina calcarata]
MYPSRYVLLLALADHIAIGLSLPTTTYDQRQNGDLNVQVHLKDVQVLALLDTDLLDDYTEYDYIYDYADFTIKPIGKPTTGTTTTTEPALSVSSETTDRLIDTSDSLSENSTYVSTSSTEEATTVSFDAGQTNETTGEEKTSKKRIDEKTTDPFENDEWDATTRRVNGQLSRNVSSKRLPGKRCRSGYSPDGKGRCRRQSQRRLSLIPLAMKLTPRLFDDLLVGLNARNSVQQKGTDRTR